MTEDELERRRQFVTATDVPRILRKTPPAWGGPADVYLEKVRGKANISNDAMEAGVLLEAPVLQWAEKKLGQILAGDWRVHENGINACSLDGLTAAGEVVEAKTSGIVGPGSPHQWGQEGTDEIPDYYLLQVHAQLMITGAPRAFVPALIGGRGFVMFQVWANEAVADAIRRASEQFWESHVVPKIPPEGDVPQLETLKYLRRVPGKTVSVADELVESFIAARDAAKQADDAKDRSQAALLAAIGDAEGGEWSGGSFTYLTQTRKAHEVKESTFPVLRVKPTKGQEK